MDRFVLNDNEIMQILVKSSAVFIKTSLKFIQSMMINRKLSQERGRRYIKEILHSIFFIGYINKPPIHPGDLLEKDFHSKLSEKFPDVFQSYTSQLPRRPPFSVLLEVVVETTGDRNVSDVLGVLENLNNHMVVPGRRNNIFDNVFCLGASVVSYSYFERSGQKTQNYFGASMGCKGRRATMIFICLACIETWNDTVGHAVCLADRHHRSIMLPDAVWSAAYHVRRERDGRKYRHRYEALSPCLLCQKIFPNVTFSPPPPPPTADQKKPPCNYGNCAECGAISNLLNGETSVSEETQQLNAGLEPTLKTLRVRREHQLRGHLNECKVKVNPEARFYNPELHNSATL